MGDQEVVELLRAAATQALSRGAPHSAAAYLRRALEEDAPQRDEPSLLLSLGLAEKLINDPWAAAHLEGALALTDDPSTRAMIRSQLSEMFLLAGDSLAGIEGLHKALAELDDRHEAQRAEIEVAVRGTESYDARLASSVPR